MDEALVVVVKFSIGIQIEDPEILVRATMEALIELMVESMRPCGRKLSVC